MDFEESNIGLPFTRKKSSPLVDLLGDDSIAQKLYKKAAEIIMNCNGI